MDPNTDATPPKIETIKSPPKDKLSSHSAGDLNKRNDFQFGKEIFGPNLQNGVPLKFKLSPKDHSLYSFSGKNSASQFIYFS